MEPQLNSGVVGVPLIFFIMGPVLPDFQSFFPYRDVVKLNSNSKFTTQEVNLAIMNPGGMKGKADSMSNAMHIHDIRICIVSETHCVGKEIPKLNPQTKAFHNNRSEKTNKGGVCIFVENSIAEDCVVIGKSDNNRDKDESNIEWIAIKINSFEIPVVIIGTYGCQASKNTVEESLRKWTEVFDFADKYTENHHVCIGGDMNAWIGNRLGLKNNPAKLNVNGKSIIKLMNERKHWSLVNSYNKGDNRTHQDRSSPDSHKALDYIITNRVEKHTRVIVDTDLVMTPYKVKEMSNEAKVYSDHKTVMTTFNVKDSRSPTGRTIVIRDEEGWINF